LWCPHAISRNPAAFYELLGSEGVTVLNQTPSAFRQLMWADENAPEKQRLHLRYVIFGGEALELQSLRPWFDRHPPEAPLLVNMYGITETTVHVTYRPIYPHDIEENCGSVIGEPIPDLTIQLLDEGGKEAPTGNAG
jgi:non-ribosomal peptide synthetase component F